MVENKLDENLKKLPKEVRLRLFDFFNQKELKHISTVNKKFQEFSNDKLDELANKYKSNIYYTVGIPIQFSDNKTRRAFFDTDLHTKYRNEIPLKEIYDSFTGHRIENIQLFKIEWEAYEYSRYLRTGDFFYDGNDSFQPAVFKVIYLSETNSETKQENLIINSGCSCSAYDLNERTSKVEFFEVKRADVIPLEGTLKIQCWSKDAFRNYGIINYSNFKLTEEEHHTTSRSCIIY